MKSVEEAIIETQTNQNDWWAERVKMLFILHDFYASQIQTSGQSYFTLFSK